MSVSNERPPAAASDDGHRHPFGPGRLRPLTKALPEQARGHNRALVLQTLYHHGAMSRAALSRATGLTRVTISDLVAEFIADGIVVEQGIRPAAGPGKPAILIDLDRDGHQIIGLDLSEADAFRGALLSIDGEVLVRDEIARPDEERGEAAYERMRELVMRLMAAAQTPLLGVGIGMPGVVRTDGTVLRAPTLGWSDLPLEQRLAADVGVPVLARNDADVAVLAEYTFGGAGSDVMLIRIGRGVGAGLIVGDRPLLGGRFAAGEIGHVVVGTDGGPRCVCGRDGCLEAWLRTQRLADAIAAEPHSRDALLREAGRRAAFAIAPIVAALDLSEVVLSGPAELVDGPLLEAASQTLRERTPEGVFDDVAIRRSAQPDIVLRGAAVMVLSTQLGVS